MSTAITRMDEEKEFIKRYGGQKPAQSALLRKRLQGQVKYFDSADNIMSTHKKDVVVGTTIPTVATHPQRNPVERRLSSLIADGTAGKDTTPTPLISPDEELIVDKLEDAQSGQEQEKDENITSNSKQE